MPSTAIEPSGGYDFVAFDNVAPKTAATPIVFYTAKSAGSAYGSLDGVNSRLKIDRISEYTGSAKIQFDSDIEFSSATINIFGTSADASDNQRMFLSPANAVGSTRSAYISLSGNEHANTGQAELRCGNVASAYVNLRTDGTQDIVFTTNGTDRWEIDGGSSTGALVPKVDNTLDIGSTSFRVANVYASVVRTVSTDLSLLINNTGAMRFYTNNIERLNIENGGTFNFLNQTTAGTAGAISTYMVIKVGGTQYKLACYAI